VQLSSSSVAPFSEICHQRWGLPFCFSSSFFPFPLESQPLFFSEVDVYCSPFQKVGFFFLPNGERSLLSLWKLPTSEAKMRYRCCARHTALSLFNINRAPATHLREMLLSLSLAEKGELLAQLA
jgi:hypothetical protein